METHYISFCPTLLKPEVGPIPLHKCAKMKTSLKYQYCSIVKGILTKIISLPLYCFCYLKTILRDMLFEGFEKKCNFEFLMTFCTETNDTFTIVSFIHINYIKQ